MTSTTVSQTIVETRRQIEVVGQTARTGPQLSSSASEASTFDAPLSQQLRACFRRALDCSIEAFGKSLPTRIEERHLEHQRIKAEMFDTLMLAPSPQQFTQTMDLIRKYGHEEEILTIRAIDFMRKFLLWEAGPVDYPFDYLKNLLDDQDEILYGRGMPLPVSSVAELEEEDLDLLSQELISTDIKQRDAKLRSERGERIKQGAAEAKASVGSGSWKGASSGKGSAKGSRRGSELAGKGGVLSGKGSSGSSSRRGSGGSSGAAAATATGDKIPGQESAETQDVGVGGWWDENGQWVPGEDEEDWDWGEDDEGWYDSWAGEQDLQSQVDWAAVAAALPNVSRRRSGRGDVAPPPASQDDGGTSLANAAVSGTTENQNPGATDTSARAPETTIKRSTTAPPPTTDKAEAPKEDDPSSQSNTKGALPPNSLGYPEPPDGLLGGDPDHSGGRTTTTRRIPLSDDHPSFVGDFDVLHSRSSLDLDEITKDEQLLPPKKVRKKAKATLFSLNQYDEYREAHIRRQICVEKLEDLNHKMGASVPVNRRNQFMKHAYHTMADTRTLKERKCLHQAISCMALELRMATHKPTQDKAMEIRMNGRSPQTHAGQGDGDKDER